MRFICQNTRLNPVLLRSARRNAASVQRRASGRCSRCATPLQRNHPQNYVTSEQQTRGLLSMDRRDFLKTASVLTLSAAAERLSAAAEDSYDPTERSMAELQRALAAGTLTSEALTAAYLARIARYDQAGPQFRSVL